MPTYEPSGTLTTQSKSFSTPQQPDLTGLVYTLNGGTITLDVVGSPGAAGEETITQVLDGASSYELDWQNAHTDFHLHFEVDRDPGDDSTSPELDDFTLSPDVTQAWSMDAEFDAGTHSQTTTDGGVRLAVDENPSAVREENFPWSISIVGGFNPNGTVEVRDLESGATLDSATHSGGGDASGDLVVDIWGHPEVELYARAYNDSTDPGDGTSSSVTDWEGDTTASTSSSNGNETTSTATDDYSAELPYHETGTYESDVRDWGAVVSYSGLEVTTTLPSGDSVDITVSNEDGDSVTFTDIPGGSQVLDITSLGDSQLLSWSISFSNPQPDRQSPVVESVEVSGWVISPGAPTLTGDGVTDDSISQQWSDVTGEDGYHLYLAESPGSVAGDYTQVDDLGADVTQATISGRENGEQFYVRVGAYNSTAEALSNEITQTTTTPSPSLDTVDNSVEDELTVEYTLNDNSTDGDVLVEYSTDGGGSWSEAGTVSDLQAGSFTHQNRPDGTTHTYRVTRRTDHDSATSGTASATTILPNPSGFQIVDEHPAELDGEWTDNHDTGTTTLQYRRSSDSTWQDAVTGLSIGTEAATATGLLNGEAYDLRAVAVTQDTTAASAASGVATATTVLPDEDTPVLGNGVEDEIAVDRETATTNYGSVRVQIRETSQTSWDSSAVGYAEQVLDYDTLSTIFTGREDGEEYEVRARTETEHTEGAWTTPVSIITEFPGAVNPDVTASTPTSHTVTVDDNADNEDGFRLEREERLSGEWRDHQVVSERGPHSGEGEVTFTDDTATPGVEYRYRVEAFTEHASATSEWTPAVETPSLEDVTTESTGSRDWRVRVEHESGAIHRPRVLDATRDPSVSDLPSLEVTVPRDDKWTTTGFEDATVKAWKDGRREPVETLVDTKVEDDRHVLVLEGAQELLERVTRTIDQQEAHALAEDLLTTETTYGVDVDDPQSGEVTESLMQSTSTSQEFLDSIQGGVQPEDALLANGDSLAVAQAAWTREGEASDTSGGGAATVPADANDDWSNGTAALFGSTGAFREYILEVEHTIPEEEVGVWIRYGDSSGLPAVDCILNGYQWSTNMSGIGVQDGTTQWRDFAQDPFNDAPGYAGGDLTPGTYTLRIEQVGVGGDGEFKADVVAPLDNRFDWSFPDDTVEASDGGRYLEGPGWYPDIPVVFEDAITDLAVLEGRFEGSFNDTSGDQQVELSNDQGSTYPVSASNTSSVEGAFPASGGSIRARVTLSSYGTAEETPGERRQPQALESYSLYATLDETPLIINQDYDDSLLGVLQEIADTSDAVFGVLPDGDSYEVVWTWPRQRESDLDPGLVDYNGGRTTQGRAGAAVVKGASQSVAREEWTASLDTWVDLTYERVQSTSVSVWDPSGTVESVEEDEDYEVDRQGGRLQALSSGGLEDGETYAVSYEWKAQGSYESPEVEDPREESETIPGLSSNRACGQAARRIVETLQEPRYRASIQVSTDDVGWNVIEALHIPELGFPEGVLLEVRGGESSPGRASFEVGLGETLGEVTDGIRARVDAVEDRV